MALAGLKKQFNKANQYMNEKIGGVEGTKFTDEFTQLERRTDLTCELVDELINRTKEYLQPNPASRTKLMVSSKLKGVPGKPHSYPQPEGILADAMCKYGKEIDDDSNFARSLVEMGEALREMAEVKYALEDNVKQNFLEPLTHLQAKDLKDVLFHRKKLEGRRLDYDCKKRKRQKGTHVSEEEIRMAEEKLEESYNLASMGMHNLLQNEIEQLSQLCVLSEALYEYHSQCANILESLNARLMDIKNEAAQRTFQPYVPKKLHELNLNTPNIGHDDLSPGDAHMINGSKFYSNNTCDFLLNNNSNNKHNATHNALANQNTATKASSLSSSSSYSNHSSPLSIKSGKFLNDFLSTQNNSNNKNTNDNNNSTTSYLLKEKNGHQQKQLNQHKTLSHSRSLLNVSNVTNTNSFNSSNNFNNKNYYDPNSAWDSWDDNNNNKNNNDNSTNFSKNFNNNNSNNDSINNNKDNISDNINSNKYDLLRSGINFNMTNIDWNQCRNNLKQTSKSSTMNSNHNSNTKNISYRNSSYHPATSSSLSTTTFSSSTRTPTDARGPCCQALYDFDAENENELSFKEGDIIQLVTQVDENWYEGSINDRTGLFPVSYVQVLVPIH